MSPQADRAGSVFAALADERRRWIVRELAEEGPLTATQLAARTEVSRQAVGKHLAVLEMAGLVVARRSGREALVELRPGPFSEAEAWMRAIGASSSHRLDALKSLVEGRICTS